MKKRPLYLNWTDRERILEEIQKGSSIIVPTETVVGLMSLPKHTDQINEIKKSPMDKPIASIIGSPSQIKEVWPNAHPSLEALAECWPGPLTLIFEGVSARMPDYPPLQSLLEASGPMACSSANFSTEPAVAKIGDIDPELIERVDVVIDEQHPEPLQVASTILMLKDDCWHVLREGSLSRQEWTAKIEPFGLAIEFPNP